MRRIASLLVMTLLAWPGTAARAFTARLRPELVRDVEAMRANVASRAAQVLDAGWPDQPEEQL